MTIRELLSADQLGRLQRVFHGHAPWTFELYQPLRAFCQAVVRLDAPDLPARIHFYDALWAIDEVTTGEQWPCSGRISPETFAALGYAETSAGITRLEQRYSGAWREHAQNNRAFLLRASEAVAGGSAIVVGAGKLYDIPLRELSERFSRLVLIDVDLDAMTESVERSGLEAELRRRVALVQADVTGVNETFLARAKRVLAERTEDDVYAGVLRLLHSYRLPSPLDLAGLAGLGRVDACFSSMVLSQLGTPLTALLRTRYAELFPRSQRFLQHELQVALGQFTHRVQHTHVRSLLDASPYVVVTTDVAETAGVPQAAGVRLPVIGAPSLEELFPATGGRLIASARWNWQHVPASKQPPGAHLDVNGVAFLRAEGASSEP
jgi:hypothetical protein